MVLATTKRPSLNTLPATAALEHAMILIDQAPFPARKRRRTKKPVCRSIKGSDALFCVSDLSIATNYLKKAMEFPMIEWAFLDDEKSTDDVEGDGKSQVEGDKSFPFSDLDSETDFSEGDVSAGELEQNGRKRLKSKSSGLVRSRAFHSGLCQQRSSSGKWALPESI